MAPPSTSPLDSNSLASRRGEHLTPRLGSTTYADGTGCVGCAAGPLVRLHLELGQQQVGQCLPVCTPIACVRTRACERLRPPLPSVRSVPVH